MFWAKILRNMNKTLLRAHKVFLLWRAKIEAELRQTFFPQMKLKHIPAFYHKKDYIKVLADSIKNHLDGKEWDKLLFS